MNYKCPHCGTVLQQLGRNIHGVHSDVRSDHKVWVGENLYRCQDCRAPQNRFMILGAVLMSAAAEGWLSMTSPEVQREVTV